MNKTPDNDPVRKIVLPSGRAIEVVRLGAETTPADRLHVCPECNSQLVQPVEWSEVNGGSWELMLQCPNCRWISDGIFTRAQIDKFEEQLDEGLADMLSDLRRLTEANMTEEIDLFVRALAADCILPEDF